MTGDRLLDANILTAWAQRDEAVLQRLGMRGTQPMLCAIVIGEVLAGVEKLQGQRREQLRQFYGNIFHSVGHLPIDLGVARQYALTRDAMRQNGTPIPENDLWIAACAMSHDVVLVSRDAHFDSVPGLRLERW